MSVEKETLSALMDGEVSDLELRRVLKSCQQDDETADRWQRYHLASAVMKREPISSFDLSKRVMMALEEEQTKSSDNSHSSSTEAASSPFSGMLRSFISMGVAASVTAVVILGPSWLSNDEPSVNQAPQAAIAASSNVQRSPLLQPVTFGQQSLSTNYQRSFSLDEDMIRSPQGMQRYIDQHLSLVESKPLEWGLAWLPEGYQNIRHESTRAGEVMVFSNGLKAFSVSVEQLGMQTMPEGVIDAGDFIALGQAADDRFVTVVGDMPIMVAERIAAAVTPSH
ncbi:MAG: hypothetical protein EA373_02525 [Oceanospirillales bacterium]|nr:MAG: hypothetical protein EA373_02525 [Oceanospirillales bacterium]